MELLSARDAGFAGIVLAILSRVRIPIAGTFQLRMDLVWLIPRLLLRFGHWPHPSAPISWEGISGTAGGDPAAGTGLQIRDSIGWALVFRLPIDPPHPAGL